MNTEVMFSSQTKHWSTPMDLFNKLNSKYHFTLDACADTTNYKVKKYFNEKQNGLIQSWQNNIVWVNPPYGRTIGEWVKKASEECSATCSIMMLLPARVDTRWFHDFIYHNPHCTFNFIKGRLKFSNSKSSAPFPSMLVYFSHPANIDWLADNSADLSFKIAQYHTSNSHSGDNEHVENFMQAFSNQIELDGKVDVEIVDKMKPEERAYYGDQGVWEGDGEQGYQLLSD